MIDPVEILGRYGSAAPRYTSYPTAPQFKSNEGAGVLADNLSALSAQDAVSIYVHIPYCDRLCWFCGCHTKHTLKYAPVSEYVAHLEREIRHMGESLTVRPVIGSIHFGGGSPSLLHPEDLERIRNAFEDGFDFDPKAEISFEIDPSDGLDDVLSGMRRFGITRASIGVQDFNTEVQRAINRPQSFEQTRDVVEKLRDLNIQSINIDALYGLPYQDRSRLQHTLEKCVELQPDRMALFGYAHVPWLKPHQKLIPDGALPGSMERFEHNAMASTLLQEYGYAPIGIDHFAKPGDTLAIAAKNGTMRRNFQGYTTDNITTLIGFGASSIGHGKAGYVQNTVAIGRYKSEVKEGCQPVDKGYRLTSEDRFRGALIEQLMCNFEVDLDTLNSGDPNHIRSALRDAQLFIAADRFGLLDMKERKLSIPVEARPFTRIVAMQFDQYAKAASGRFSKAV